MIQYDMIWLDIVWYDMILYAMRYCDIIWQNSTISLHTLLSCITQFLSRCRIHSNSKPPKPQTSKTMPDIFHTKNNVLIGIHTPFIWDPSRLLNNLPNFWGGWPVTWNEKVWSHPHVWIVPKQHLHAYIWSCAGYRVTFFYGGTKKSPKTNLVWCS